MAELKLLEFQLQIFPLLYHLLSLLAGLQIALGFKGHCMNSWFCHQINVWLKLYHFSWTWSIAFINQTPDFLDLMNSQNRNLSMSIIQLIFTRPCPKLYCFFLQYFIYRKTLSLCQMSLFEYILVLQGCIDLINALKVRRLEMVQQMLIGFLKDIFWVWYLLVWSSIKNSMVFVDR